MDITDELVSALAPDPSSLNNGKQLVKKKQFSNLGMDKDKTIIMGDCAGSGKNPYKVSVDFIQADKPVFRCSCPSRKIPCKHALGLMLAYTAKEHFATMEVPDDIVQKRDKSAKRKEAGEVKKESAPKKVSTAAQVKKIQSQLDGLELAERLLSSITQEGFAAVDSKKLKEMSAQAKQLGDYYLPGVQTAFWELIDILCIKDDSSKYSEAQSQAVHIFALVKKGREYLLKKKEDPKLEKDTTTEIESLLGYPWRLEELECENDAKLAQLTFMCIDNVAAKRFEDIGVWVDLKNGNVYQTRNYRPYTAKDHIAREDSVLGILATENLYIYPGKLNRRIRWNSFVLEPISGEDLKNIIKYAGSNIEAVVKGIKDELKSPLADRNPFALITFKKFGTTDNGDFVLEDEKGYRLLVTEPSDGWPDTLEVVKLLGDKANSFNTALVRFKYIKEDGLLPCAIFTLINDKEMVRLGY